MKFVGGPDDGKERELEPWVTYIDVMTKAHPLRYDRYYVVDGQARHSSLVSDEHKIRISNETPIAALPSPRPAT